MCGENLQIEDLRVIHVAEIDFVRRAHIQVLLRNMMLEGFLIIDP
jgi:hypothetical protein